MIPESALAKFGASLKNSVKTWLVGTWSIKLDENAGFWRYQTRGAKTKLGEVTIPMGCQKNRRVEITLKKR